MLDFGDRQLCFSIHDGAKSYMHPAYFTTSMLSIDAKVSSEESENDISLLLNISSPRPHAQIVFLTF